MIQAYQNQRPCRQDMPTIETTTSSYFCFGGKQTLPVTELCLGYPGLFTNILISSSGQARQKYKTKHNKTKQTDIVVSIVCTSYLHGLCLQLTINASLPVFFILVASRDIFINVRNYYHWDSYTARIKLLGILIYYALNTLISVNIHTDT